MDMQQTTRSNGKSNGKNTPSPRNKREKKKLKIRKKKTNIILPQNLYFLSRVIFNQHCTSWAGDVINRVKLSTRGVICIVIHCYSIFVVICLSVTQCLWFSASLQSGIRGYPSLSSSVCGDLSLVNCHFVLLCLVICLSIIQRLWLLASVI